MTTSQWIANTSQDTDFLAIAGNVPKTTIWAVGGNSRGSGRTVATAALSACLASKGYQVHALNSFLDWRDTSCASSEFPCAAENSLRVIANANESPFLHAYQRIIDGCATVNPNWLKNQQHLVVDLSPSLAHSTLDLFLAADIQLIFCSQSAVSFQEAKTFYNSCLLRLIEVNFPRYASQIHKFSSALSKSSNGFLQGSSLAPLIKYFSQQEQDEAGQLLRSFNPFLVVNKIIPMACKQLNYGTIQNHTHTSFKQIHTIPNDEKSAARFFRLSSSFINSSEAENAILAANLIKARLHNRSSWNGLFELHKN
jgi:MinD-like ATPase involved in chromosome partitioning or flagellar assembly